MDGKLDEPRALVEIPKEIDIDYSDVAPSWLYLR